jgi:hypothetical protein
MNCRQLERRVNVGDLRVGDTVLVWVEVSGTHKTRSDPGYRVTRIRGVTVWVTHLQRGGQKVLHRSKVKVVDTDLPWDEIAPRPTRYAIRQVTRGTNEQTEPEFE